MCRAPVNRVSSFALWLFCLGVACTTLTLGGCGGGGGGNGGGGGGSQQGTPTSISNIAYTPNPVPPGGTAVFTGTVNCSGTGTCPQSITWSAPANDGSFAGSTYTAPAASGSYTVTATPTGYSVSATATVSVTAPLSVSLVCPPLVQIGVQGNVVPPTSYVCTASASDGKGVTFSTSGVGMSINPSTGALSVTASDSDIGNNNYLPVTVTATASDGKTSASATVLVTDWFLAENGQGTQIMTSAGAVVQSFHSLAYDAEAFAPDHLSFVGVNLDKFNGFDVYAITVASTNGTVTIGVMKTRVISFTSEFTAVVTPAYSPDGTQIVFVGLTNDSRSMGTYVIAANGMSAEQDLYPDPGYGSGSILVYATYPHFTADGNSIDFERLVNGQYQIWKMNATDGSDQTALFTPPGAASPFPTADGKYLMFWMNNGIYRAYSNGSAAELIIQAPTSAFGANGFLEAISPDGKQIMYLITDPATGWWFLWTANVDGSNPVQITPNAGVISPESWGD